MDSFFGTKELNQIAFVVHDIEKAAECFALLLGIPKPQYFLTATSDISKVIYRGKPVEARSKLIFINTPSVQIELIEPDEVSSIMRDFLNETGEGIHHVAFEVDHIQKRIDGLPDNGFSVVQTGEFTASKGRYLYLDTLDQYKTLIELLEREDPQAVTPPQKDEDSKQPLLGTDVVKQLAIVVNDLEAALDAYCKMLGVDQPKIIESGSPELTQVVFHGKPTDAKSRYAFIDTPLIQIELIEPVKDSPSTWLEHLEKKGEGVHHIAFVVQNLNEKVAMLEKSGYPLIQKGNFWNGKGKYAYMDTTSEYKVIIELLERYDN